MEGTPDAARYLTAVSKLSREAMQTRDISALLTMAVDVVAATFDTECVSVLELLPDGKALRLRAGVGWREGLVGAATVDAGLDSQAGYTLLADRPVVVEDLRAEPRFRGALLLVERGVVSGISAVIPGLVRPWGVVGTHSTRPRRFGDDDAQFIQTVASVLGLALERARADEARARATALVEASPDAVVELTLDGTITRWNQSAERLYGYPPTQVLGRSLTILVPAERANEVPAALERVRRGEYGDQPETRQVRQDGHLIDVGVRMVPVQNEAGRVVGAVMIGRDLTEYNQLRAREHAARIRAEVADAQRKREERFRVLVERIEDDTVLMLDPQGYVDDRSAGGERDAYYRDADVLAKHVSIFYLPEDAARGTPAEELRRAVAEGRAEVEGWRVRNDGSRFWAGVVTTSLRDPDGRLTGFVRVSRDLTERKRTEDALLAATADLQDAVRTRDALLRSTGDDLRHPLATIRDHVQRLRAGIGELAEADDDVLADGLAAIETLAIRLTHRVEGLAEGGHRRADPSRLEASDVTNVPNGDPSVAAHASPATESGPEDIDHRPDGGVALSGHRQTTSWLEEQRAQFLHTIPAFRTLPPDALRSLASVAQPRRARAGQFIFLEGEPLETLKVVAEGQIKLLRETPNGPEVLLRLAGPGEMVGIVAVGTRLTHRASAVAQVDTTYLSIPRGEFFTLLTAHPAFARALIRLLGQRLYQAETRICILQAGNAERRIAWAVLGLARLSGVDRSTKRQINIPISREDLARLAGTNVSTVSRTTGAWARKHIVIFARTHVRILDERALRAIAGL